MSNHVESPTQSPTRVPSFSIKILIFLRLLASVPLKKSMPQTLLRSTGMKLLSSPKKELKSLRLSDRSSSKKKNNSSEKR